MGIILDIARNTSWWADVSNVSYESIPLFVYGQILPHAAPRSRKHISPLWSASFYISCSWVVMITPAHCEVGGSRLVVWCMLLHLYACARVVHGTLERRLDGNHYVSWFFTLGYEVQVLLLLAIVLQNFQMWSLRKHHICRCYLIEAEITMWEENALHYIINHSLKRICMLLRS